MRLNRLSDLLGLAQQKASSKLFIPSEMYFEHKCNVHGLRCRNKVFQEEQCKEKI